MVAFLSIITLFYGCYAAGNGDSEGENGDTVSVATSCTDLEDGHYMLQLINDDSYPLIWAQCSNGYAILDYSKDNDWINYLSSYKRVYQTIGAPQKDDHVNWENFYLGESSEFLVSPQCDACSSDDAMINVFGTTSAYYHSASISACVQMRVSRAACDMRLSDDVCQMCWEDSALGMYKSLDVYDGVNQLKKDGTISYASDNFNFALVGSCPFHIYKSDNDYITADDFQLCGDMSATFEADSSVTDLYKPSFGLDGKHCMCLKSEDSTQYVAVSQEIYQSKMDMITPSSDDDIESDDTETEEIDNMYYLYSSDFEDGTYRILKSGTYILMDDIVLDFKSSDSVSSIQTSSDLSNDDLTEMLGSWNGNSEAWWPTESDSDRYEGAGALIGPYWMGFYAGLSIEADNVILDLNQHSISMSTAFYYQQGFFALIALTSQAFIPFQGFGNFGSDPTFASYVTVKNGKLGLSSHHGIQGHYNKHVLLEDLVITDFKTHGIQMNGFTDVTIRNVEIGPNSAEDKLRPYYTQMRHLLPVYKKMASDEDIADACISLSNRDSCVTMTDLVDELVTVLDMAFEYAVANKDWDSLIASGAITDEELTKLWSKNKGAMVSDTGTAQTSALYGLFMNYPGSNVLLWYTNKVHSNGATLQNVYVHDLSHKSHENLGFAYSGPVQTPYQSPVNAYMVFGDDWVAETGNAILTDDSETFQSQMDSAVYIGNIVTDLFVAAYDCVRSHGGSWNYVSQSSNDMWRLANWVTQNDASDLLDSDNFSFIGGQDAMFHPGKGIIGVRFNGVDGVIINGLKVENLHSETKTGCEFADYSNNPTIQSPYMRDFGMNGVHGLSFTHSKLTSINDITIQDMESDTGLVFGIDVWFSTDYLNAFGSDITVSRLEAGATVEEGSMDYDSSPNYAPEACAVRVEDIGGLTLVSSEDYPSTQQWTISDITAEYGCAGSTDYTAMGTIEASDDNDSENIMAPTAAAVTESRRSSNHTFFNFSLNNGMSYGFLIMVLCLISFAIYYKYYRTSAVTVSKTNVATHENSNETILGSPRAILYGSF